MMRLEDLHDVPRLVRWVKVSVVVSLLTFIALVSTCIAMLQAQTVRHQDTSEVTRVEMRPEAGRILHQLYDAASETQNEKGGCLYGDVEDGIVTIRFAEWAALVPDTTRPGPAGYCQEHVANGSWKYLGVAFTHVVGPRDLAPYFTNEDIALQWQDREQSVYLIVWGKNEDGLSLSFRLSNGVSGRWHYAERRA